MQETAGTRGRCHRKPAAAHCARKLAAAADLIGSLCGRLRTEWNARGWFGHEVCDGGLPECLLDLAHGIIQPAMKRAELSSVRLDAERARCDALKWVYRLDDFINCEGLGRMQQTYSAMQSPL